MSTISDRHESRLTLLRYSYLRDVWSAKRHRLCICSSSPARREHVQSVVEIEIIVAVEVTADKVIDLLLGNRVHVLELVHRTELDDIETVGQNTV